MRLMLQVAVIVAVGTVAVVMFLARYDFTDMAPSHTWPILLDAIDQSEGVEHERRLAEFRAVWRSGRRHGDIRRVDWVELAKRWNVCDGLTNPSGCRLPPGPLEAQGLAVEALDHLASRTPRYEAAVSR